LYSRTHARGDSYAVAQRFWDFSAVFAAPVRLTIALIFLYKCAFISLSFIIEMLTLLINRVLGWSSLISVAVVSIAWLFNYPLIQWNVRVSLWDLIARRCIILKYESQFARSMLQAMDKRLNTVDELLQNIRFLKIYGWGKESCK
jgi:hypothetical protein